MVLDVDIAGDDQPAQALAYPRLVGRPAVGDTVTVSTAAWTRGLGTGGFVLVTSVHGRSAADPEGPGHQMKARYTPQQVLVTAAEEPDSASRAQLEAAAVAGLGTCPVVVAELHSALAAVVAGVRAHWPQARVGYVMDDSAALPVWFSRSVARLQAAGWLAGTVTTGQAYGGDVEAVTLHSGLLAARAVLEADVIVTSAGPGSTGTSSRWGFSGVAAGEAVNAVVALGARPLAVLRLSASDPRPGHVGLSHHSVTAFGRVALGGADLVWPAGAVVPPGTWEAACDLLRVNPAHRLVPVEVADLPAALALSPVPLISMGRRLAEDPLPFLAAAAAGLLAASRAVTSRR